MVGEGLKPVVQNITSLVPKPLWRVGGQSKFKTVTHHASLIPRHLLSKNWEGVWNETRHKQTMLMVTVSPSQPAIRPPLLTGAVLLDHVQNLLFDLRCEVDPLRSVHSYKVATIQDTLWSTLQTQDRDETALTTNDVPATLWHVNKYTIKKLR